MFFLQKRFFLRLALVCFINVPISFLIIKWFISLYCCIPLLIFWILQDCHTCTFTLIHIYSIFFNVRFGSFGRIPYDIHVFARFVVVKIFDVLSNVFFKNLIRTDDWITKFFYLIISLSKLTNDGTCYHKYHGYISNFDLMFKKLEAVILHLATWNYNIFYTVVSFNKD